MRNRPRVRDKELAVRAEGVGCGSFERRRLLKLWWDSNRSQFKNPRVLHLVPKDPIKKFVRELPNESFDLVICSDVLEHVNDKSTLCELHRILSKDGAFVTMTQRMDGAEKFYDDTRMSDAKPRLVQFDQADHVMIYGADFRKRVLGAGFSVEGMTAASTNTPQFRPSPGDNVFVCHK